MNNSVADPDPPDPHVFGPPGSGSISQRYGSGSFYHSASKVRKTLISTVLRLIYDFLSLTNEINVPSNSNKQKLFFVDVLKVTDKNSRFRIRIHYLEEWIRESGSVPKFHGSATLEATSSWFFSANGSYGLRELWLQCCGPESSWSSLLCQIPKLDFCKLSKVFKMFNLGSRKVIYVYRKVAEVSPIFLSQSGKIK